MNELRRAVDQVKHLSASSLSDFIRCPLLWYGRRIAKWPEPPSIAMAAGSALHQAMGAFHKGEDAELVLLASWQALIREHNLPAENGSLARAVNALAIYCDSNPRRAFDECETFLKAPVPNIPVPLIGFVDLLRPGQPREDGDEIHEWKTGNPRWGQRWVDSQLQTTAYWWLYQQETGQVPRKVVYHRITFAREPVAVVRFETTRTQETVDQFVGECQIVYRQMVGLELSARCPVEWCSFREQCDYWLETQGQERQVKPKANPLKLVV